MTAAGIVGATESLVGQTFSGNGRNISTASHEFVRVFEQINSEIGKVVVGMEPQRDMLLMCLMVGGHGLLESTPGKAKTLLAKTIAEVSGLNFKRVQFTPDLMPSDIIGTEVFTKVGEESTFKMIPGPIFTNILLADEINRTPPKTQAALLEPMEEKQVTIAGVLHKLPAPFFVIATMNPIQEFGTYPLPVAQHDRFLIAMDIPNPTKAELVEIANRQTRNEFPTVSALFSHEEAVEKIASLRRTVRDVQVTPEMMDSVAEFIEAFDPLKKSALAVVKNNIEFAPSPRALIASVLMAKATAAKCGRDIVLPEDLTAVIRSCIAHRLVLKVESTLSPEEIIVQVAADKLKNKNK